MARVFAFFRYTGTMLRGVERERIKNDRHLSFLAMTDVLCVAYTYTSTIDTQSTRTTPRISTNRNLIRTLSLG